MQSYEVMELTAEQLAVVTGGGDLPPSVIYPKSCTPSNPTGAPVYTQSMGPDHSGPSIEQKVNDAYDKAMAPWQALNSLAGPWAKLAGVTRPR